MSRKALGRGLEALIPEAPPERAPQRREGVGEAAIDAIRPNPFQPRTVFDPEALQELAGSIRENGLIQPLVVRETAEGSFELIAGERRFLAAQQAGLTRVPVVVRQASRREMLEVALIENLQREDLNPVEEAEAYQRLATEFGLTQEEIAKRVGKSRTAVTNALRLLSLEQAFRDLLSQGRLSAGHARALLAVPPGESRKRLAKDIVDQGLSVRQAEARVNGAGPKAAKPTAKRRSHPALEAWEGRLRDHFGTQVRIAGGLAKGRVEIHYFSGEDLERILELAGVGSAL
jgi:ParB family chromosome partitioning protein